DGPDLGARELLETQDVGLGRGRQVGELPAAGDVLGPAVQVLVDGLRVVEVGLRHRHLVVPHAVDLVRHADRDLLPAGEHVELGEVQVGEAVHASGVAGHDRVVPATATDATGGDTDLTADGLQLDAVL